MARVSMGASAKIVSAAKNSKSSSSTRDGYSSWIASRCSTTSSKASTTTKKYNKSESSGNTYIDRTAERLRRMLEADQKNKKAIEACLQYIDNLSNTQIDTHKVYQDLTYIRDNYKTDGKDGYSNWINSNSSKESIEQNTSKPELKIDPVEWQKHMVEEMLKNGNLSKIDENPYFANLAEQGLIDLAQMKGESETAQKEKREEYNQKHEVQDEVDAALELVKNNQMTKDAFEKYLNNMLEKGTIDREQYFEASLKLQMDEKEKLTGEKIEKVKFDNQKELEDAYYKMVEENREIKAEIKQNIENSDVKMNMKLINDFLNMLDSWLRQVKDKEQLQEAIEKFKKDGDFISLLSNWSFRYAFREALSPGDSVEEDYPEGNIYERLAKKYNITEKEAMNLLQSQVEKAGKMYGENWRDGAIAATAVLFSYICESETHFTYIAGNDPATHVDCRGAGWPIAFAATGYDYEKTKKLYGSFIPWVYHYGVPEFKSDGTPATYFVESKGYLEAEAGDLLVNTSFGDKDSHVEIVIFKGKDDLTGEEQIYTFNYARGYIQTYTMEELKENKHYFLSDGEKYYKAISIQSEWIDKNSDKYSIDDMTNVIKEVKSQTGENGGSVAYWNLINAMEAELNGGAKVVLDGKTYTTIQKELPSLETTTTSTVQTEKVLDGYSSWIADRQIINDLVKVGLATDNTEFETEMSNKLTNNEISQRQYEQVMSELKKAKLENNIQENTTSKPGNVYPTIGEDGMPLGIDELIELYETSYQESTQARVADLYVKETGQIVHNGETLKIPLGETYTVYVLHPYDSGIPTATAGCEINQGASNRYAKSSKYAKFTGNILHKDGNGNHIPENVRYGINYVEYTLKGEKTTNQQGMVTKLEDGTKVNTDKNGVYFSVTIYYNSDKHSYKPEEGGYALKAMTDFFVEVYEP